VRRASPGAPAPAPAPAPAAAAPAAAASEACGPYSRRAHHRQLLLVTVARVAWVARKALAVAAQRSAQRSAPAPGVLRRLREQ
jgi:hypothetical protein